MMLAVLAVIAATLAFVNGANDNIKGAATLVGSGLVSPRHGLWLTSAVTAAGGLASVLLAGGLLAAFSGKGLVPDTLVGSAGFLLPVGVAAASTVAIATWFRMPVSTTHALVGGLLGAGAMAAPDALRPGAALATLAAPLILVPMGALALAWASLPLLRHLQQRTQRLPEICACVSDTAVASGSREALLQTRLRLGTLAPGSCEDAGTLLSLRAERVLNGAHLASAAAVSFARGLNDTPKIAALALASGLLDGVWASLLVVAAMLVGGLVAGHRITRTMAFRITRMDPTEGLGGNLVASSLILAASPLGLPVSTTHVTVGALFGVAAGNRGGHGGTIRAIALSWLLTLPLAAALAAFLRWALH